MSQIYKSCPKCGADCIEPAWHDHCNSRGSDKVRKEGKKRKAYVSFSALEHLHYFCKCGYDWTVDIREK